MVTDPNSDPDGKEQRFPTRRANDYGCGLHLYGTTGEGEGFSSTFSWSKDPSQVTATKDSVLKLY